MGIGGRIKNIFVKIQGDTSDLDSKIQDSDRKIDAIDESIDNKREKARQLWAYANQLGSMILSNLAQAAEGTRFATQTQAILSGIQKAQTQVAIFQTGLEAKAAFLKGNVAAGIMLSTIAAMMQTSLIKITMNEVAAQKAQQETENFNMKIDNWRAMYN